MAAAVVHAFGHIELPDPPARKAPTRDVEAYRFFLQAESIVNGTPESFLAAIALYDEALVRDPSFARALAGRALNRAALAWTGSSFSQGVEQARRDAEAALELDPTLARAHVVLASIAALRGDWISAEASFRTAIAQNPTDPDIRGRYAVSLLLPTGQLQRARSEALEAGRLAPSGAFPQAMRAFVEQALGADELAVRLADGSISRGGDPRQMAVVYASSAARRGAFVEAADHAVKALPAALLDANGAAAFRLAYAALGDPAKKSAAIAALSSLTREPAWEEADPRSKQLVLDLYASLGEIDMLYGEMDRPLRPGDGARPAIVTIGSMWSPAMRAFRQDPRFATLVQRLALVDYWQRFGPPDGCVVARGSIACH
jgi:tetratricopeptide (TPR) repeat protein